MVVANTRSGATERFDLRIPRDVSALQALSASGQITAIGLLLDGRIHILPPPTHFNRRRLYFGAELVENGECAFVEAGGVRASITARGNVIRFDVARISVTQKEA